MTIAESIGWEDLTEEQESIKKVEKRLDKERGYEYEERDSQCKKLSHDFFILVGAKMSDEITELFDKKETTKTPGWTIWFGEDVQKIYKNGKFMGTMNISCRGNMYGADLDLADGRSFHASNRSKGEWVEHKAV